MPDDLKPESVEKKKDNSFVRSYVERVFTKKEDVHDRAYRSALRRAMSPAQEHFAWAYLPSFVLNFDDTREVYALISSAIAWDESKENGNSGLGTALRQAYELEKSVDYDRQDPASARMRRLLACHDVSMLCKLLKPVIAIIQSKGKSRLDYADLLQDLLWFRDHPDRIKVKWASQFYSYTGKENCRGEAK